MAVQSGGPGPAKHSLGLRAEAAGTPDPAAFPGSNAFFTVGIYFTILRLTGGIQLLMRVQFEESGIPLRFQQTPPDSSNSLLTDQGKSG